MTNFTFVTLLAMMTTPTPISPIIVCPAETQDSDCAYTGGAGLRSAVTDAADGATILVRSGTYQPSGSDDVAYQDIAVRAFLAIRGKSLTINGEGDVIIDGAEQAPGSAMVIENGALNLDNIAVRNFHYADSEDLIYDGHGIFAIDSRLTLSNVRLSGIHKMAVTGRGTSTLEISGIQITNSHIGFWLEETAQAVIADSLVSGGDVVGICAYGDSHADISNSVFAGFQDDGLYTDDRATITGTGLVLASNHPFAARASGESHIALTGSTFLNNSEDTGTEGQGRVTLRDINAPGEMATSP